MKSLCPYLSLSSNFVANTVRLHDAVPVEIFRAFIQHLGDILLLQGSQRITLFSRFAQYSRCAVQPFG
jgi:hypothetical protein